MVLEQSFRNLTPLIPRSVLLAKQLACDPLPPLTASSIYNDVFFAGAEEIFSVRPQHSLATSPVRQALSPAPQSQVLLVLSVPEGIPTTKRRAELCLLNEPDSSDDEDGRLEDELINSFNKFGAQRVKAKKEKPKPLLGPLVIPSELNLDWREAARRRRAGVARLIPDSAKASTGADGSVVRLDYPGYLVTGCEWHILPASRSYFVNHNTRSTLWKKPALECPAGSLMPECIIPTAYGTLPAWAPDAMY